LGVSPIRELLMTSTLRRPNVRQQLDRLHHETIRDDALAFTPAAADETSVLGCAQERESLYMPSPEPAGRLLYALAGAFVPTLVVEFGMSYGISALRLAAAVADAGHRQVITSPLSST
jgi:predicted O-methyltransferase YrrM